MSADSVWLMLCTMARSHALTMSAMCGRTAAELIVAEKQRLCDQPVPRDDLPDLPVRGSMMHEEAKRCLERLHEEGRRGQAIGATLNEWRRLNRNITDFAGAVFDRLNLTGKDEALLNGLDLTGAVFKDCVLQRANFRGSRLANAIFRKTSAESAAFQNVTGENAQFVVCNLMRSALTHSKLSGTDFRGSDLRAANLSESNLDGAVLLNVEVDHRTRFAPVNSIKGCSIDRYALSCLGPDRGGLTEGNLMSMDVQDDVAALRSQFGGVWAWGHLLSVVVFIAPYVWFLVSHWSIATFSRPKAEKTITLAEALGRYIVSGGEGWREGWNVNWIPLLTFLGILTYNAVRMALLWKTKRLETQQQVMGLPARFSLQEEGLWMVLLKITSIGFWFSLLLVAVHTWHFLMMRIPV